MNYYIIETNYVGPNQDQDQYVDADRIEISTKPAITNSSHEERTEGWCGTTNDWAVYAHGEYATIEAAEAAIAAKFGEVRTVEPHDEHDDLTVATYKVGKYAPMGVRWTGEWAYPGMREEIHADTTDARIAELAAEYEAKMNSEGYTLDRSLENMMREYRQELRDEVDMDMDMTD